MLPRRVIVKEVLDCRYSPGQRPLSWDKRYPGVEGIVTTEGESVTLYSNGGQSSPRPGWELLLLKPADSTPEQSVDEDVPSGAISWTLYGIKKLEENPTSTEEPDSSP